MKNLLLFLIGLGISLLAIDASKKIEGAEILYYFGMFQFTVIFIAFLKGLLKELNNK
jgi:hypothetical protein